MANPALREARRRAHLSQTELARRIREAGFSAGDANGCTVRMVQRWESGQTRRPHARYLLALESVLGQPAESLGFDADVRHGIDRARAISEAGLDSLLPLPEPTETYGPRTGIWLSSYTYESSGRGQTFTSRHYVIVLQRGARLMVRSLPASASRLSMDLTVNGHVVTGTWAEETERGGYYRGAVYTGAIQMLEEDDGGRFAGRWVGFGKENEVNTGPWSLTLVDEHVDAGAVERWDRPADNE
ncbi:MAG: helix-turn-helix domain-containing protein [Streptosporangiaceae bacterium]